LGCTHIDVRILDREAAWYIYKSDVVNYMLYAPLKNLNRMLPIHTILGGRKTFHLLVILRLIKKHRRKIWK